MGIFGPDADYDGQILGTPLHGERLKDRLFVRDAQISGEVELSSNDPLSAEATVLGIGVNLGSGSLSFDGTFQVDLMDPGTPESLSDGASLVFRQRHHH